MSVECANARSADGTTGRERLDPTNTTAMWPFGLFFTPKWKSISNEKLEARKALIQVAKSSLSAEATTAGDKYTRASGTSSYPTWVELKTHILVASEIVENIRQGVPAFECSIIVSTSLRQMDRCSSCPGLYFSCNIGQ